MTRPPLYTVKYGRVGDADDGRVYTHTIGVDLDEQKASRDSWLAGGGWGGWPQDELRVWVEDRSGAVVYGVDTSPTLTVDITVPGRVWYDALDPMASSMQAELGLPDPEWRTVGKGSQARYRAVPVDVAIELSNYLDDRGDALLGQRMVDPYDPMEQAERGTLRAAVKTAAEIRARVQRARVVAARPGLTLDTTTGQAVDR